MKRGGVKWEISQLFTHFLRDVEACFLSLSTDRQTWSKHFTFTGAEVKLGFHLLTRAKIFNMPDETESKKKSIKSIMNNTQKKIKLYSGPVRCGYFITRDVKMSLQRAFPCSGCCVYMADTWKAVVAERWQAWQTENPRLADSPKHASVQLPLVPSRGSGEDAKVRNTRRNVSKQQQQGHFRRFLNQSMQHWTR